MRGETWSCRASRPCRLTQSEERLESFSYLILEDRPTTRSYRNYGVISCVPLVYESSASCRLQFTVYFASLDILYIGLTHELYVATPNVGRGHDGTVRCV